MRAYKGPTKGLQSVQREPMKKFGEPKGFAGISLIDLRFFCHNF